MRERGGRQQRQDGHNEMCPNGQGFAWLDIDSLLFQVAPYGCLGSTASASRGKPWAGQERYVVQAQSEALLSCVCWNESESMKCR